jgi:peroxiredoxin
MRTMKLSCRPGPLAGLRRPSRKGHLGYWIALLILLVGDLAAFGAGSSTLELGQAAPPIKIGKWVRGGPINLDQVRGSNVLVLDLWSSDYQRCRYTIPYLTGIQKKFAGRGVLIVGVSAEPAERIKWFLPTLETPLGYAVAADSDHQTSDAYAKGTSWEAAPHSFVIDRTGRLVWHGDSTVALEQVLNDLLDGKLELEAARRTVAAEKQMTEYFLIAKAGTNTQRTVDLGEQIIANATAYPSILNEFAWKILTEPRLKQRDYNVALRCAQIAFEKSSRTDVPIMDTYARALFAAGRHDEAIELEKKAIKVCEDVRYRPELESVVLRWERMSGKRAAKLPQ